MNSNKSQNKYFYPIVASFLAVFSIFFLIGISTAHAEGHNRNSDSWGNRGGHSSYDCGCENDHRDYYYSAPTPNYIYKEPTYAYTQPSPTYIYQQPVYQQPIYQYQQPVVYQQPIYTQPTYYQQPTTYYANNYTTTQYQNQTNLGGLTVSCSSDPSVAFTNQPVTWTAQVVNGLAPYTYSWTGSDGLTGTQSSVLKYYSTLGQKSAVVTVTSSDGLTGTITCGNSLTIRSASGNSNNNINSSTSTTNNNSTTTNNQINSNSAAAFGSIGGISFAIFAILLILILIATIFYIVLSRSKI